MCGQTRLLHGLVLAPVPCDLIHEVRSKMAASAAPASAAAYTGPSKEQILKDRRQHIGYNCALNYSKSPLLIVRGQAQHLFDEVSNPVACAP